MNIFFHTDCEYDQSFDLKETVDNGDSVISRQRVLWVASQVVPNLFDQARCSQATLMWLVVFENA